MAAQADIEALLANPKNWTFWHEIQWILNIDTLFRGCGTSILPIDDTLQI